MPPKIPPRSPQRKAGVGHLVVGGVERDLPSGPAETAGAVGEHDEPVASQGTSLIGHRVLAAAEAVGQQNGGRQSDGGGEEGGIDGHRLVARRTVLDVDGQRPFAHRVGRSGSGERDCGEGGEQQEDYAERKPGALRASAGHPSTLGEVLCGRRLRSCDDRLRRCDDVDVLHPWRLREKGADDFSPPGERR